MHSQPLSQMGVVLGAPTGQSADVVQQSSRSSYWHWPGTESDSLSVSSLRKCPASVRSKTPWSASVATHVAVSHSRTGQSASLVQQLASCSYTHTPAGASSLSLRHVASLHGAGSHCAQSASVTQQSLIGACTTVPFTMSSDVQTLPSPTSTGSPSTHSSLAHSLLTRTSSITSHELSEHSVHACARTAVVAADSTKQNVSAVNIASAFVCFCRAALRSLACSVRDTVRCLRQSCDKHTCLYKRLLRHSARARSHMHSIKRAICLRVSHALNKHTHTPANYVAVARAALCRARARANSSCRRYAKSSGSRACV